MVTRINELSIEMATTERVREIYDSRTSTPFEVIGVPVPGHDLVVVVYEGDDEQPHLVNLGQVRQVGLNEAHVKTYSVETDPLRRVKITGAILVTLHPSVK